MSPITFFYKQINMSKWLVAVDDGPFAAYAFNYALEYMDKKNDRLYILNVMEEPTRVFVGYATASLIESLAKVEDSKARKILVHYGHKAKESGVLFTTSKRCF